MNCEGDRNLTKDRQFFFLYIYLFNLILLRSIDDDYVDYFDDRITNVPVNLVFKNFEISLR